MTYRRISTALPIASPEMRTSNPTIARWHDELRQKMDAGATKAAAVRALVLEQPELHRNYISAYTAEFGPACGLNTGRQR